MVWGLDLATIRVLGLALFMVLIVVLPGPQSRRHSRLFSSESQQGRLRGLVRRWIGVLEFAVEFGVARGGTREALELVGTHGQRREQLAVLGARVLQVEVETVLGGQRGLIRHPSQVRHAPDGHLIARPRRRRARQRRRDANGRGEEREARDERMEQSVHTYTLPQRGRAPATGPGRTLLTF